MEDDIQKRTFFSDVRENLEYVISDESVDGFGTIIETGGWDISQFKKNPIALFNHDKNKIIGRWEDVRIENKRVVGRLTFAKAGTSPLVDEIRSLAEQGILRGTSVGFRSLEQKPDDKRAGVMRLTKQKLVEVSLVSVGANDNALQLARSLNVSAETQRTVFGKPANEDDRVHRQITGMSAENPPAKGNGKMSTIAERVQNAQTEAMAAKAALETFQSGLDDNNITEQDATKLKELNASVRTRQSIYEALRETEQSLGESAIQVRSPSAPSAPAPAIENRQTPPQNPRPFAWAQPSNKVKRPGEHMLRALTSAVIAQAKKSNPYQVLAERYGEDGHADPQTKTVLDAVTRGDGHNVFDFLVTRAATAPATTTTAGWASQLVETTNADFMDLLMPASVYPGLASRGMRLSFGRSGVISIPTRAATPTIAGSFVAEGAPIPVRQGAFTAITFTPKKMAVISSWTREIGEHSTPAIESLIRNAIQEDTSVSLDSVLLDATAASTTRPAGIRNGVGVTGATAGGGFTALIGDIKGLLGVLITGSNGNLRNPVWIMNPAQAISISLTQNAGGDFPFAGEINNNRLQGYPVIISSNVTAGMVILVDAADFVVIEGGAPRFDLSDQAVLVYDDTAPAQLGTTGAPNVVGAPARSLWQTDSVALRMIMDVNWGLRRTGVVAWTQAVTW